MVESIFARPFINFKVDDIIQITTYLSVAEVSTALIREYGTETYNLVESNPRHHSQLHSALIPVLYLIPGSKKNLLYLSRFSSSDLYIQPM
jgi:hypothetical protein